MKRLMAVAVLLLMATSAGAQRPGPGGFPPPSPQMRAKFHSWQKWGATHKNITALQRTIRGLDRLEQSPTTRLNKQQAHAVLTVLNKWRTRPTLTDAQAQQVVHQIKANLNVAQARQMAAASGPPPGMFGGPPPGGFRGPPSGGFRGPPPGGFRGPPPGGFRRPPGGFGGPPPPGRFGGPPPPGRFNPASFPSPREYNPLNPKTSPFARDTARAQQRLAALMATLAHTK